MMERRAGATASGPGWKVLSGLATFHLVCLTWIFFRAASFADAWTFLGRVVTWSRGEFFFGGFDIGRCAILVACLLAIDISRETSDVPWRRWLESPAFRGFAYGAAAVIWLALGAVDANVPFIYFQF